jgi:transposase-like protein
VEEAVLEMYPQGVSTRKVAAHEGPVPGAHR